MVMAVMTVMVGGCDFIESVLGNGDSYDSISQYLSDDGSIDIDVINVTEGLEVDDDTLSDLLLALFGSMSESGEQGDEFTITYDGIDIIGSYSSLSDHYQYRYLSYSDGSLITHFSYDNGVASTEYINSSDDATEQETYVTYMIYTEDDIIMITLGEDEEWLGYLYADKFGDILESVSYDILISELVYDEETEMYNMTADMILNSISSEIGISFKFLSEDTIYVAMTCYGETMEYMYCFQDQTVTLPEYTMSEE